MLPTGLSKPSLFYHGLFLWSASPKRFNLPQHYWRSGMLLQLNYFNRLSGRDDLKEILQCKHFCSIGGKISCDSLFIDTLSLWIQESRNSHLSNAMLFLRCSKYFQYQGHTYILYVYYFFQKRLIVHLQIRWTNIFTKLRNCANF